MVSKTAANRFPMIVVPLVVLVASVFVFAEIETLAQDGSKGTDPSGAYNISAATITTARPSDKPDSQPGSSSRKVNKKFDSRTPKDFRKPPASSRQYFFVVDKDFPGGPPPRGQEYVRIGVTVWRLGPSQCPIPSCPLPASTGGTKSLVDTATRIEDNSPLSTGERVRLGLESLSHAGFVYIIDREQFSDGTMGEPYLLFPTRKINNGQTWAQPGLQIQLPRADGCFCVKSRNPQKLLVADNLVVIVSPTQLLRPDEIGENEILLPNKLSGFLRRADQSRAYRGSLRDGSGLAQTSQELRAGVKGLVDTEPVLTQNDLPPQNFYQSSVPTGTAAVFSFSLRYDTARRGPQ